MRTLRAPVTAALASAALAAAAAPLAAPLAAASLALGACVSARGATPTGEVTGWVRDIRLDNLRGEVGRPFESRLTWRDNYIEQPEFDVSGLPPGLRFDPASRRIVGTPTSAGFFPVSVAIRKHVPEETGHRPHPDERWWPASFELEIYAPVGD